MLARRTVRSRPPILSLLALIVALSPTLTTSAQTHQATDDDIPWLGPEIKLRGAHEQEPPKHLLRGYLFGLPFRGERAKLRWPYLTIHGSTGTIRLLLRGNKSPWGITLRLPATQMRFESKGWRGDQQPASAAVAFEQPEGRRVKGRLILTGGSQLYAHVAGTFEAAIAPDEGAEVPPFAKAARACQSAAPYALVSLAHRGDFGPQRGTLGSDEWTVTLPDGQRGDLFWFRFAKAERFGLTMDGPEGVAVTLYTADGTRLGSPGAPRRAILDPPPKARFLYALVTGPKDARYTMVVRKAVDLAGRTFEPVELEKTYDITIPADAPKLGKHLTRGYAFNVPAQSRVYVIHKRGPTNDRRPSSYLLSPEGIVLHNGFGSGHQCEVEQAGRYMVLHMSPQPCRFSMLVRTRPTRR